MSMRSRAGILLLAAALLVLSGALLWVSGSSAPVPVEPPEPGDALSARRAPLRPSDGKNSVESPDRTGATDRAAPADPSPSPQRDDAASSPKERRVAGRVVREEDGFPARALVWALDESGEPTSPRRRASNGHFLLRVGPEATALRVLPDAPDLEAVTLPLPPEMEFVVLHVRLPKARGFVEGQVVDSIGDGVAGVRVSVGRLAARTDEGGQFRIAPLRDGPYIVRLPESPFTTRQAPAVRVRVEGGRPDRFVLFRIHRGALLEVKVVRGADQGPVERASVVLTASDGRGGHLVGTTNREGAARFVDLEPGDYRLFVSAPEAGLGTATVEVEGLGAGDRRRVRCALEPAPGVLTGVVRDEEGAPVPFARIVARRLDGEGELRTSASSSGRFGFDAIAPGRWRLAVEPASAVDRNWVPGPGADVDVTAGRPTEVSLVVRRGASVSVELERGRLPGPALELRVLRAGEVLRTLRIEPGREVTAVSGLAPGSYRFVLVEVQTGAVVADQVVAVGPEGHEKWAAAVP